MKKILHYLLAITALVAVTNVAKAQGGANPYVNSTHTYTVAADNSANTLKWKVLDASKAETTAGYSNSGADDTQSLTLTWTAAGTYYLQFEEDNGTCATKRELEVIVDANTFFLTMDGDGTECHDKDGQVIAQGASENTTVEYTVNLNKDAAWDISTGTWEYDFAVSSLGDYSIVSATVGSTSLGDSGSYSDVSVSGNSSTSTITLVLNGNATTGATPTITVSNGEVKLGSATTPDNTTGDKTQMITVNALPNTSPISFN